MRRLVRLGPALAAGLAASGWRGDDLGGVIGASVSATCVGCGMVVSGEDLMVIGVEVEDASTWSEKRRRLRLGYCARRECRSSFCTVGLRAVAGVDWEGIWREVEREWRDDGGAVGGRVEWRARWRRWLERAASWSGRMRRPLVLLGMILGMGLAVAVVRSGVGIPGLASRSRSYIVPFASVPLHPGRERDAIPPVDRPEFVRVAAGVASLDDDDWVVAVRRRGVAKAYPLWIMTLREIVNDRFGSEPVCVTYCPLTESAAAFIARVGGKRLTFGNEGSLYECNLVMYDRETESLWYQLGGVGLQGAHSARRLEMIPAPVMRWGDWRRRHPGGEVLVGEGRKGRFFRAGPADAGSGRFQRNAPFVPVSRSDDRLPGMAGVAGFRHQGWAACLPVDVLEARTGGPYRVPGLPWPVEWRPEDGLVRVWTESGIEEIPLVEAYWFAWHAAFPDGLVIQSAIRLESIGPTRP